MERNDLEKIRLEKIERMRAEGIEPYPTTAHYTHRNQEAIQAFEAGENIEGSEPIQATSGWAYSCHASDGKDRFCTY